MDSFGEGRRAPEEQSARSISIGPATRFKSTASSLSVSRFPVCTTSPVAWTLTSSPPCPRPPRQKVATVTTLGPSRLEPIARRPASSCGIGQRSGLDSSSAFASRAFRSTAQRERTRSLSPVPPFPSGPFSPWARSRVAELSARDRHPARAHLAVLSRARCRPPRVRVRVRPPSSRSRSTSP
mgnify:CR=1 FL=1